MSWWLWVLLAWFALSFPAAILIGRFIAAGDRDPEARGWYRDRNATDSGHAIDDEDCA